MERWQEDFIAGLIEGKTTEWCAKTYAGQPLAVVHTLRETDEEFALAWDEAVEINNKKDTAAIAVKRILSPAALEALLWAQTSDKRAAAYFGMKEDVFMARVKKDADLNLVYETARDAGMAAIELRQFQEGMAGNQALLTWFGKQHLGQSDKVEKTVIHEDQTDSRELARRLLFLLAQGAEMPVIDVETEAKPQLIEYVDGT